MFHFSLGFIGWAPSNSDSFWRGLKTPPSVWCFQFSSFWINALIAVVSGPWYSDAQICQLLQKAVISEFVFNLLTPLMNGWSSFFSSNTQATTLPLENQGIFVSKSRAVCLCYSALWPLKISALARWGGGGIGSFENPCSRKFKLSELCCNLMRKNTWLFSNG